MRTVKGFASRLIRSITITYAAIMVFAAISAVAMVWNTVSRPGYAFPIEECRILLAIGVASTLLYFTVRWWLRLFR